jgi:hypothetical protein
VVVPALPVRDVAPTAPLLGSESLPPELQLPILKCPVGRGTLNGLQSGVRSALVKLGDGRWYRLKGCGNGDQGMIVKPVSCWRRWTD